MFYLLLVLLILDAIVLSAVVLLQAGQGGGLASLGGGTTDNVLGSRQSVTLLTKATWWTGGIFLALSLVLSLMSANRGPATSSLQERLRATQPAPAPGPVLPGTPSAPATGTPQAAPAGQAPTGQAPAQTPAAPAPNSQAPTP
jgi:preprotein translocase subunit SecG